MEYGTGSRKYGLEFMEDKLQRLITAGAKENRTKWAHEWQGQGKKVVGVLDSLVPEEVIYAAGMLPWRIQGTWQQDVSQAMMYRLPQGSAFLNHALASLLDGELDFLDGMVCSNRDEDFVRFWDYWKWLSKMPLIHLIEVPIIETEPATRRFATKVLDFIVIIESFGQVKITDSSLHDTITVYNRRRALLRKMYELRKRKVPPLSGSEVLAITTASMIMPPDEFNRELEGLLPYLDEQGSRVSYVQPRLLLSSDLLDSPAWVNLVEETGCLVAMDDLDTGSRYFWEMVDSGMVEPAYALAACYLKNRSPRMLDWRGQAEQLVQWAKEFHVDGLLELPDLYDYTRGFRRPFLERWLKQAGIPMMSFGRDYHLANVGQIKTRIGAFLEILESNGEG
jgi:benzoyl-CoA reductase/2-hydroxyglutaryl-CoA dehydratase subunit BcrC/BadD/HgdB